VDTKTVIKNFFGALYFIFILLPSLFFLCFTILGFIVNIMTVRQSGFAGNPPVIPLIALFGVPIMLSLLVPAFRQAYYKLPWLFPLVKTTFVNMVIAGMGTLIIDFGYQVQEPARNTLFTVLAIAAIAIGRLLMCIWFNKKKVEYVGDTSNG
jgi:hypothetical protein